MTRFTNGPAAQTTLMLRRAPLFLRVVRAPDGKIDALDQLDDKPAVDEDVFIYRKTGDSGMVHINACDKRGRRCGGFFAMATYALVEPQPETGQVRTAKAWQTWAQSVAKEGAAAK